MFKYVYAAIPFNEGVYDMKNYVLAIFAIAMIILTGCSGAKEEVTTEKIAQETQQKEEQTPIASGAAADFQNLMAAKEKLKYQITYDVTTKAAGQEMKSTMIQYFDGANRMRTDTTIKGVSETRMYVIDSTATSCVKINSKWTCTKSEVPKDPTAAPQGSVMEGATNYAITADGTKQIFGKSSNCYKSLDSKNSVTMRYCFFGDGVPVYISSEMPQATTEMTALLYGKDAAETVWVIPA